MSTTSNASYLTLTDEEERSFNPGNDIYYFTSNNSENDYSYSLDQCTSAGNTEEECKHYHAGNFYNYYAAAALGATSNGNPVTVGTNQYSIMPNSICPAGWRLPTGYTAADSYDDFDYLLAQNNVLETYANQMGRNPGYTTSANGFYNIRTEPIWLTRAGYIYNGTHSAFTSNGNYHLNTVKDTENNHMFNFG